MTSVLVLVDIQNDYFPGGRMELHRTDEAAARARRLLEQFRIVGGLVFHIQHVSLESDATFFQPGTEGVRINELVAPAPGETVVTKHTPNSFHETDLQLLLREVGAERLVIAGMMSHMCIDSTTRAASDLGFDCTVASDACTTRNLVFSGRTVGADDVHAAYMAGLEQAFAQVTSVDDIIETLG